MKRESKFPWWGWVVAVCLVPVLYLLSIFPVVWIVVRFDLEFTDGLDWFYEPVFWAADEWEWFGSPLVRIFERMGIA